MPIYWYTFTELVHKNVKGVLHGPAVELGPDARCRFRSTESLKGTAGGAPRRPTRFRYQGASPVLKFVVRRAVWTIPVVLLVIFFTFVMMRQIKGNPFQVTERAVPASIQANLDRKYHLNKPWYTQYLYYVEGVFKARPRPVARPAEPVGQRHHQGAFPGLAEARNARDALGRDRRRSARRALRLEAEHVWDYFTMAFVNSGSAIPNFLVSTLLIYFFAVKWRRRRRSLPTNAGRSTAGAPGSCPRSRSATRR